MTVRTHAVKPAKPAAPAAPAQRRLSTSRADIAARLLKRNCKKVYAQLKRASTMVRAPMGSSLVAVPVMGPDGIVTYAIQWVPGLDLAREQWKKACQQR